MPCPWLWLGTCVERRSQLSQDRPLLHFACCNGRPRHEPAAAARGHCWQRHLAAVARLGVLRWHWWRRGCWHGGGGGSALLAERRTCAAGDGGDTLQAAAAVRLLAAAVISCWRRHAISCWRWRWPSAARGGGSGGGTAGDGGLLAAGRRGAAGARAAAILGPHIIDFACASRRKKATKPFSGPERALWVVYVP